MSTGFRAGAAVPVQPASGAARQLLLVKWGSGGGAGSRLLSPRRWGGSTGSTGCGRPTTGVEVKPFIHAREIGEENPKGDFLDMSEDNVETERRRAQPGSSSSL